MVGSIVLTSEQGLGYLAKDFYDWGLIDLVYIHNHTTRKNHPEWYPDEAKVKSIDELIDICDILVFFETPFDWKVILKAREKGVRTILIPMYECTRNPLPYVPDKIFAVSDLDETFYRKYNPIRINIPVDMKWHKRNRAISFVHNAGNGGLGGRNGTKELIQAMQYVKSPVNLTIHSQVKIKDTGDERIKIKIGTFNKEEIFKNYDVFVFPEKFNGLSLPLQEAYASGMLVMAGDRFPMNKWLPNEPLIKVKTFIKENIGGNEFYSAVYDPVEIAKTIDKWYGEDIEDYSIRGQEFGAVNSHKQLKDRWQYLFYN